MSNIAKADAVRFIYNSDWYSHIHIPFAAEHVVMIRKPPSHLTFFETGKVEHPIIEANEEMT